jgi:hypothetical protein
LAPHLDQNLTNIHWIVTSSNRKTPHVTYDVKFDYSVDCLTCICPHYQLRSEYCEHCISVLLFEEGASVRHGVYWVEPIVILVDFFTMLVQELNYLSATFSFIIVAVILLLLIFCIIILRICLSDPTRFKRLSNSCTHQNAGTC